MRKSAVWGPGTKDESDVKAKENSICHEFN
jgi:hypothetical protein